MKAAVYRKYGSPDVLSIEELPKPVPKDNEILVKVHATTVSAGDIKVRSFKKIPPLFWIPYRLYLGIRKPKRPVLGMELAGEVESLGKGVKLFKIGDRVFANSPTGQWGAYAQYICLPENGTVAVMPSNMNYTEAAAVPYMGGSALFYLRNGNVRKGCRVLINGASGSVGTYAVQLARYFGAEVTGVCSSRNIELVKSLGADRVIDYTKQDFTEGGCLYDLIFDAVATDSFRHCNGALAPDGIYLSTLPSLRLLLQMLRTVKGGGKRALYLDAACSKDDLIFLKERIEEGALQAVIDRTYPLERIVEAHRYVDTGHKRGNVVLTVDH